MKRYSIAARLPGNIIVRASSKRAALRLAQDGLGAWEADDADEIEIVGNLKRGIAELK